MESEDLFCVIYQLEIQLKGVSSISIIVLSELNTKKLLKKVSSKYLTWLFFEGTLHVGIWTKQLVCSLCHLRIYLRIKL